VLVAENQPERQGLDGVAMPPEIDPERPSIARVYDFVIGGKQHFEIDRQVSKALYNAVPEIGQLGRAGRNTLLRVVRWLVDEAGIDQIVDLGSGLPTEGNVHEIALASKPDAHVVYVDSDPIVLAHARALLDGEDHVTVIQADVTDTEAIFTNPELLALIDLDRPFAIITSSILHHLEDDVAGRVAADLRSRMSPGSYLMSANFLDDDERRAKELQQAFLDGGLGTGRFRTWSEQAEFFDGLELVEPGLVYADEWRADAQTPVKSPVQTLYAVGVGKKKAG
jgi:hypothetical protein